MGDAVREWKRAVHDPEVARLRATIKARDGRNAELEAALWVALDGVEIVIEPGQHAGGRIETIRRPDGSVLVRRERLK